MLYKDLDYALSTFDEAERNIVSETRNYASKSTNMASISFAGVALIISQNGIRSQTTRNPLVLIVLGFLFFVTSFKLEVFAATKRIVWDIQQRSFNCGVLSVVSGTALFILTVLPQSAVLILLFCPAVAVVHIAEFVEDYRHFG